MAHRFASSKMLTRYTSAACQDAQRQVTRGQGGRSTGISSQQFCTNANTHGHREQFSSIPTDTNVSPVYAAACSPFELSEQRGCRPSPSTGRALQCCSMQCRVSVRRHLATMCARGRAISPSGRDNQPAFLLRRAKTFRHADMSHA